MVWSHYSSTLASGGGGGWYKTMDTEGLGENRFAPKPLAFKLRGGGGRSTFPLSLKATAKEVAIRHVQQGSLGCLQLAPPGNTPKTYSPIFTEGKGDEESVVGFGEGARKDPTPYHYRCARDTTNNLHALPDAHGSPSRLGPMALGAE